MDFEHKRVEVDAGLADGVCLQGVVQQIHEVGLPAARPAPEIQALGGREGLEGGGNRGTGRECVVGARVLDFFHCAQRRGGGRGRGGAFEPAPGGGFFGGGGGGSGGGRSEISGVGVVGEKVVVDALEDLYDFSLP